MAGLSARTVQRIESGQKASTESLKCLAAALDVTVETLLEDRYVIDRQSTQWQDLPFTIKLWFRFNFLQMQPSRRVAKRVVLWLHGFAFVFVCGGIASQASLVGGIILLANAYLFQALMWQGDHYGVWYDAVG